MDWYGSLTPQSIWQIAQNRPSLVADDLERAGVPRAVTHTILLARGVYKWLAVRRGLIDLKNQWRAELTQLYIAASREPRGSARRREIVARIRALEECRAAVRGLCHSPRWSAPDNDREALRFLESYRGEEEYG